MEASRFQQWICDMEQLTTAQALTVSEQAKKLIGQDLGSASIASHTRNVEKSRCCPFCGQDNVWKHGRDANGRQRFRCRPSEQGGCGRSFNGLTGTPFSRMREHGKWPAFCKAMAGGHRSIDELHRNAGIAVSRLTLWRWRRRFLSALEQQPATLQGVVEIDETWLRDSHKGSRGWKRGCPPASRPPRRRGVSRFRGLSREQVPVLTGIDRSGARVENVMGSSSEIPDCLRNRIAPGSVICTDGLAAYRQAAVDAQCEHRVFKPIRGSRSGTDPDHGVLSLARVNAHHHKIKTFVNRNARGVSTKHLKGYLNWLAALGDPLLTDAKLLFPVQEQVQH